MDLQKQLAQATTDKSLLEAKLSQTQASLADVSSRDWREGCQG